MKVLNLLFGWLAAVNALAFVLTAVDKHRAKHGGHRVREAVLLWMAALGGGIGLYAAMVCLRHKTKKLKFMLGVPLVILAHALLFWGLAGLL